MTDGSAGTPRAKFVITLSLISVQELRSYTPVYTSDVTRPMLTVTGTSAFVVLAGKLSGIVVCIVVDPEVVVSPVPLIIVFCGKLELKLAVKPVLGMPLASTTSPILAGWLVSARRIATTHIFISLVPNMNTGNILRIVVSTPRSVYISERSISVLSGSWT